MKPTSPPRPTWLVAAILATPAFLGGLSAFLIAAAAFSAAGSTRAGPSGSPAADLAAHPDLEIPLVAIERRGTDLFFRLGDRDVRTIEELKKLLEPLARLGGPIQVRLAHDLPFARSWDVLAACRAAGFATVLVVPREAGR